MTDTRRTGRMDKLRLGWKFWLEVWGSGSFWSSSLSPHNDRWNDSKLKVKRNCSVCVVVFVLLFFSQGRYSAFGVKGQKMSGFAAEAVDSGGCSVDVASVLAVFGVRACGRPGPLNSKKMG